MSENLPVKVEVSALAAQFPILNPEAAREIQEIVRANTGPRGLNPQMLDHIKVPPGGQTNWVVPGPDGDEAFRELSGVVLSMEDNRLYYRVAYAERGKVHGPPDCISRDTFIGVGDPGGECRSCPMAQWGSDPKGGRGQACKEVRRLLLLRSDRILPDIITIPPTSLKPAQQYFTRLINYRIPHWGLITNLRLERVANADGVDYSRVVFGSGARFSQPERETFATYQQQMATLLRSMDIDATDFEVHDNDDDQ